MTDSSTTSTGHAGRGLGITAFILSIFLNIVGVILGIIALMISRRAGVKNGWAVAAIVVGAVIFVVLGAATLVGLTAINTQCGDLGPGVHQWNGLTLTCP
ncbi:hypothetical protein [Microterricola viridarii]|uniref:DUF4190 domain-containing protein n=1 Tax=Microterricola viridarii TaxID=412690 RepID=A0A109QWY5_9MICO|nr:hypothetical protein [Microterricola viridarii]AMB59040.1 hypothetical protein AWU67_09435 [Microterricola viridarii]